MKVRFDYNKNKSIKQATIYLNDFFIKENKVKGKILHILINNNALLLNATYSRRINKNSEVISAVMTIPKKYVEFLKLRNNQEVDFKILGQEK